MRTIYSSWGWGWSLWVQRWLVRPIHAQKVLWQYGQGMVAAVGDLFALFFLTCLCCSADVILLALQLFVSL